MEQLGTNQEGFANLNRIQTIGQHSSSIYSSVYNEAYQKFRTETFELEEPYRNFLMQPASRNPVYQRFMGVKYLISQEEIPGYEKWGAWETQEYFKTIVYRQSHMQRIDY